MAPKIAAKESDNMLSFRMLREFAKTGNFKNVDPSNVKQAFSLESSTPNPDTEPDNLLYHLTTYNNKDARRGSKNFNSGTSPGKDNNGGDSNEKKDGLQEEDAEVNS